MKRINKPALFIYALVFMFGVTGFYCCSKDATTGNNGGNNGGSSGNTVSIKNFAFSVATLTTSAGATVTWTNNDAATHTVTADDGSFNSGNIAPGATFTHTFSSKGTVAYHCSIHPMMKASVVIN